MENDFDIGQVASFWDKVADGYDSANRKFGGTHLQRFAEALRYMDLKPGQKVLNVWSRTGLAIPYLRGKCPDVDIFNLEVSLRFIDIASKKFPKEKFLKTTLEKLPFENDYFDYVLSLETLEHAPNPSVFIGELYRMLKPQGLLVLSLPPATAELPLRIYETFFTNHGEGPHKFLPSRAVKNLLKTSGFRLVVHKGTLLIPVGPNWIKKLGEKIIDKLQNTPIRELGIRQFYICKK